MSIGGCSRLVALAEPVQPARRKVDGLLPGCAAWCGGIAAVVVACAADLPIEEIARQVGLGSAANLRARFRRAADVSPQEHRRLFAFGQGG
ncbi:hypothetical protein OHS18_39800 [Amycolatopsis sp. NBC_00355]|uniref:hypothetical protein n=1 Tax=Amycolatopsis sp. NBC_00355 TaxID=2975957 RepID=UPI002E259BD1